MVSKNATTSYTRTYTWNISKEADLTEATVNLSVDTGTDVD
ncbi:hypothetical protein [Methanothermobacter sp.]